MIERWCVLELDARGLVKLPPDHVVLRGYGIDAGHTLGLVRFPHQEAIENLDQDGSKVYVGEHVGRGAGRMRARLKKKLDDLKVDHAKAQSMMDVWDALLASKGLSFEP